MAALTTTALLALTAAQGASQAIGQIGAGKAARKQGQFQQQVGTLNAQLSEAQAQDAIARGQAQAVQQRTAGQAFVGSQQAAAAGSGVDVASGSAADLQDETRAMSAVDEQTIRNNAMREAFGYKVQAMNDRLGGQFANMAGQNAATAMNRQAFGTLLTTGSDLYNIYRNRPMQSRQQQPSVTVPSYNTGATAGASGAGMLRLQ